MLALVAGSIRKYLKALGNLPELPLRAAMAVSLRVEGDDEFSNKVTTTAVTLATDQEDPIERLRTISDEANQAKDLARGSGMGMTELLSILPPILVNTMLNTAPAEQASKMMGANLIVSNVRGCPEPMFVAGARMETMYPMSILTNGMCLNVTCVSYAENVDFGIVVAPDLFPQPWDLVDGLGEVLAEYLLLARKSMAPPAKKPRAKRTKAATEKKAPVKRKTATSKAGKAPVRRKKGK